MAKLVASTKAAPGGALITAEAASGLGLAIAISWGEETAYSLPGGAIGATNSAGIARLSHSLTNSVLWSRSRTFWLELEPMKILRLRAITSKLTFFPNFFSSTSFDN